MSTSVLAAQSLVTEDGKLTLDDYRDYMRSKGFEFEGNTRKPGNDLEEKIGGIFKKK